MRRLWRPRGEGEASWGRGRRGRRRRSGCGRVWRSRRPSYAPSPPTSAPSLQRALAHVSRRMRLKSAALPRRAAACDTWARGPIDAGLSRARSKRPRRHADQVTAGRNDRRNSLRLRWLLTRARGGSQEDCAQLRQRLQDLELQLSVAQHQHHAYPPHARTARQRTPPPSPPVSGAGWPLAAPVNVRTRFDIVGAGWPLAAPVNVRT